MELFQNCVSYVAGLGGFYPTDQCMLGSGEALATGTLTQVQGKCHCGRPGMRGFHYVSPNDHFARDNFYSLH